jgi:hypothetical protein
MSGKGKGRNGKAGIKENLTKPHYQITKIKAVKYQLMIGNISLDLESKHPNLKVFPNSC